jgi:hypothetical protein
MGGCGDGNAAKAFRTGLASSHDYAPSPRCLESEQTFSPSIRFNGETWFNPRIPIGSVAVYSRLNYLQTMALSRKVQESTCIDATVLAVHRGGELLYLQGPEQEALRVIPCPPKYERPCKGDQVTLELRLELGSAKGQPSWKTYIIRFPGDGLDRESIHDVTEYDS